MAKRSAPRAAAAARHQRPYVQVDGSRHDCTISWNRPGVPPARRDEGGRTGGIDRGGRSTIGADRNEKSGLRSAVRGQLFIERAAMTSGEMELRDVNAPIVADICQKLDAISARDSSSRQPASTPSGFGDSRPTWTIASG